jgi:hypothetical protein
VVLVAGEAECREYANRLSNLGLAVSIQEAPRNDGRLCNYYCSASNPTFVFGTGLQAVGLYDDLINLIEHAISIPVPNFHKKRHSHVIFTFSFLFCYL